MQLSQINEYWPVLEAAKQGKTIQVNMRTIDNPLWESSRRVAFNLEPIYYRVKPTLRPWKAEEVPVGALIRPIEKPDSHGIITAVSNGLIYAGKVVEGFASTPDSTMKTVEHSLDQGKTWLPCGVVE